MYLTQEKKRAGELLDYKVTFLDPVPTECGASSDPEVVIESVCHLDEFETSIRDDAFCAYRLSGPNPTSIKLCTMDLLKGMKLGETKLEGLVAEKRLFVVDYSAMADFKAGTEELPFTKIPKHVFGSIALFKVENGCLRQNIRSKQKKIESFPSMQHP